MLVTKNEIMNMNVPIRWNYKKVANDAHEQVLKIAIQKSGRLYDDSIRLLRDCGIDIRNDMNKLKTEVQNFPMEIYFLRDDDIPQYVEDGVADIGIVGENVVFEKQRKVEIVEPLGFGFCRLSIAVSRKDAYNGIQDLQGKQIATGYPNIVRSFLKDNEIKAQVHEVSGSVEIAPSIGLAEVIVDLVSSGSTLFMNGLKEVACLLKSQAVLIKNPKQAPAQELLLQKLLLRIHAVQKAKKNKYVLLNAPNHALEDICNLLPGLKSPTILPLAEEGWSAVHSVIGEDLFWEKIEQLKAAGGEGILVMPIEQMIS